MLKYEWLKMKLEDLSPGTIVALEDITTEGETTTIAVFKGWTTGSSGLYPQMFFWDLSAIAYGAKGVAPIVVDPENRDRGKIKVLLTPKEYEEITKKTNYTMVKIFASPEAVPEEDESTIISLSPSE